jgi:hypothetical protein
VGKPIASGLLKSYAIENVLANRGSSPDGHGASQPDRDLSDRVVVLSKSPSTFLDLVATE